MPCGLDIYLYSTFAEGMIFIMIIWYTWQLMWYLIKFIVILTIISGYSVIDLCAIAKKLWQLSLWNVLIYMTLWIDTKFYSTFLDRCKKSISVSPSRYIVVCILSGFSCGLLLKVYSDPFDFGTFEVYHNLPSSKFALLSLGKGCCNFIVVTVWFECPYFLLGWLWKFL